MSATASISCAACEGSGGYRDTCMRCCGLGCYEPGDGGGALDPFLAMEPRHFLCEGCERAQAAEIASDGTALCTDCAAKAERYDDAAADYALDSAAMWED